MTTECATSISLEPKLHLSGATVRSLDPLVVETSPLPWAYAISLPLDLGEHATRLLALPVMLTVRVTVESGELGCLVVGNDWTTLLGPVPPAVGRGSHTVRVAWEHGGRTANLVFRNARVDNVPCVFHVDSVHLDPAPARLPAPMTRLQFVTDSSSPGRDAMRLTGLRDSVQLHNAATATGDGLSFVTDPAHWSYSVSIPIDIPAEPDPDLEALLTVDVHVFEGTVGVGVVTDDMDGFLSPEVDRHKARGPVRVELRVKARGAPVHLMFRNSRDSGTSSRFALLGITLQFVPRLTTTALRDSVQLHNAATATGDGLSFVTDPAHWSYSVSIPIDIPAEPDPDLEALLSVDVHVLEGTVGVGVVKDDMDGFLSPEVDTHEARGPVRVELRVKARGAPVHLMFRNSRDTGTSSRFALLGITLRFVPRLTTILDGKAPPPIDTLVHGAPPLTGVFDVLVSHTSRRWVAEQCDRGYLRERWARPDRLRALPPFDTLPPHSAPYYGLLSVLRIELSANGVTGRLLQHFASPEKVVHAAVMGSRVVVALDDSVALFDRQAGNAYLDPDSGRRIVDPWFAGLHTVIPVDGRTCVISGSGADAVLWLDTARGEVIRRWRLPAESYGTNYTLDQTTSLVEHYVANDFQLGHLNCAAPDGHGGVYVSVLGQGDIGHLRASGEYERIATDFVGCHGVRFAEADNLLYFSDSCSGRLMRVDGRDRTTVLFETGSRWLHDAVQLTAGLFLMTVGDRNRLVLGDIARGRVLAEWDFSAAEGTVQFLSVAACRI